ncbi:Transcriptional regulator, AraC family [[Actinomadura] parvosata subsp. kistnae]|uniref:HTH araC/xylS-type domain-containing protein n=1 Tax=[Actinomadura] parvosata subsp. kistnae TaxID=1909395 RepID=A0A1V0AKC5_9ACTN|nr:helix-turn-helix domain-containing protein [Nonomuraea sp. ATCC 55076]AQZ70664.1 hypothetical protein BKM31_25875 [Nonomuraea sp. ATCC 55076]SPL89228.1 Transcriptional regulator, AraC family [Actinomadura parvosata subsp. kistnae]
MIELRSTDVPAAERFQWWCDLTARQLVPTELSSEQAADFRAAITIAPLGEVTLAAPSYAEQRSVRTAPLIRRSDPEQWWVTLVCSGSLQVEQGRSYAHVSPGDLVLTDTSRPFDVGSRSGRGLTHMIMLQFPRGALPLPEQRLRDHVVRPLPADRGSAALLAGFMRGLVREGPALGPEESGSLGAVAVELATIWLAGAAGAGGAVPAETRRQALVREVKEHVRRHLGRPGLTPSSIAAACNISVRYLHRIFEAEGRTIGEYVRHERLERCRADLEDPLLAGTPVAELGARWGFEDPATFSRVFRSAYGMPPGEYRRDAAHRVR